MTCFKYILNIEVKLSELIGRRKPKKCLPTMAHFHVFYCLISP